MSDQKLAKLLAISPLEGRYASFLTELSDYFSEYALIKKRYLVEVEWLLFLSSKAEFSQISKLNTSQKKFLKDSAKNFNLQDALEIKKIEKKCNHDVKAVELFLQKNLANNNLVKFAAFVHFGLTSEDVNSIAYSSLVKEFITEFWQSGAKNFILKINQLGLDYKKIAMLSRTHGQPASPTTMGKEFKVFYSRLERQLSLLLKQEYYAKFGGAVSNFNLHSFTHPKVDWLKTSQHFLDIFGLTHNIYTTQIEPHDFLAEIFHNFERWNVILLDFCRDIWGYISLGYFKQKLVKQEVGSSVMPHKVNPIDFENAEGNLGLAISVFNHLASKLPISRWQRDLSDSTVLRNMGVCFGHSLLALKFIEKGLSKISPDKKLITQELQNSWEVLTEALQTSLRLNGHLKAYDYVKQKVRGKKITVRTWQTLVKKSDLPEHEKTKLLKLSPSLYLGNSDKFT